MAPMSPVMGGTAVMPALVDVVVGERRIGREGVSDEMVGGGSRWLAVVMEVGWEKKEGIKKSS